MTDQPVTEGPQTPPGVSTEELQEIIAHAIQPYQETAADLHAKLGDSRLSQTRMRKRIEELEKQVRDFTEILSEAASKSEASETEADGSSAKELSKSSLKAVGKEEPAKPESNVG